MAIAADARVTPGFERPPYRVEEFPIGCCVCNADGFNCLQFASRQGAKFGPREAVERICAAWNGGRS